MDHTLSPTSFSLRIRRLSTFPISTLLKYTPRPPLPTLLPPTPTPPIRNNPPFTPPPHPIPPIHRRHPPRLTPLNPHIPTRPILEIRPRAIRLIAASLRAPTCACDVGEESAGGGVVEGGEVGDTVVVDLAEEGDGAGQGGGGEAAGGREGS